MNCIKQNVKSIRYKFKKCGHDTNLEVNIFSSKFFVFVKKKKKAVYKFQKLKIK